jgi:hypothetical protein
VLATWFENELSHEVRSICQETLALQTSAERFAANAILDALARNQLSKNARTDLCSGKWLLRSPSAFHRV